MTKTLADRVTIERRFSRSARIDSDLRGYPPLTGYAPPPSVRKALTTMAEAQSQSHQGAFTWTGPYGGGKSSAALLVANLIGGEPELRKLARGIAGPELSKLFSDAFRTRSNNWNVVAITGTRTSLPAEIVKAAGAVFGWRRPKQEQLLGKSSLIAETILEEAKRRSGVLLLIDELGKFLEHAILHDSDIHVLQDLAELSSRSEGRLVTIGVLHQSFEQYASKVSRDAGQEWAKVQGRYQDISFLTGPDETLGLLGKALVTKSVPTSVERLATKVAEAVAARRPTDLKTLAQALTATWPLNPVTALLLGPVSRQRFAQNERSVFGFLNSAEPYGFMDFLRRESDSSSELYDPDILWDYLVTNFGHSIATGPDITRFNLAFDAIERAGAKGMEVHLRVAKCAAVIEFFRNGSGVTPSEEFLTASVPRIEPAKVKAAIRDLVDWAVLVRQPRLGGYAVFAGSDFDLDAALERSRTGISSEEMRRLPARAGAPFAIAKRHYFRTGALRAFDLVVRRLDSEIDDDVVAAEIARDRPRGSGVMVLALPSEPLTAAARTLKARALASRINALGVIAAVGVTAQATEFVDASESLFALDRIGRDHPQLQGDRIARRELSARQAALSDQLHHGLRESFDSASWCLGPSGQIVRDSLSVVASALADAGYEKAPVIKSELVQREQPSSNAMAAIRDLCHAMVRTPNEAGLGIAGYPAEMGLYITVLERLGLHRKAKKGGYGFFPPEPSKSSGSLEPAWKVADSRPDIGVAELYQEWAAPPYGIKKGVMPILALAYLLANRDRVAVYLEGIFQTDVDDVFVDKLLQNPTSVRIRRIQRGRAETALLVGLAKGLGLTGEPSPLAVAQEIYRRCENLPRYTKQTSTASEGARAVRDAVLKSSDPEELLFQTLPRLAGATELPSRVVGALTELEGVFAGLLSQLSDSLARYLGVNSSFSGLSERAHSVVGLTNDLRFDAFAMRAAAFEGGGRDVEGLAGMLIHKPVVSWSDRDREHALTEMAQFARRMREVEAIARVRARPSSTEAIALVVGVDPAIPPVVAEFELTASESRGVELTAATILEALRISTASRSLQLAAIARAAAAVMATGEKS